MTAPARSRITVEDVGDVTLVGFVERRMHHDDTHHVSDALFALVDDFGRRKLVLDFSSVEFWNSTVLGMLIRLQQRLQAMGGRFLLCGLMRDIRAMLQVTRLDRLFAISDASREACVMQLLRSP